VQSPVIHLASSHSQSDRSHLKWEAICRLPGELYNLQYSSNDRLQLRQKGLEIAQMTFGEESDDEYEPSARILQFGTILDVIFEFFQYTSGRFHKDALMDLAILHVHKRGVPCREMSESDGRLVKVALAVERGNFDQVEMQLGQWLTAQFGMSPVLWDLLVITCAGDTAQAVQATLQTIPVMSVMDLAKAFMAFQPEVETLFDTLASTSNRFEMPSSLRDATELRQSLVQEVQKIWRDEQSSCSPSAHPIILEAEDILEAGKAVASAVSEVDAKTLQGFIFNILEDPNLVCPEISVSKEILSTLRLHEANLSAVWSFVALNMFSTSDGAAGKGAIKACQLLLTSFMRCAFPDSDRDGIKDLAERIVINMYCPSHAGKASAGYFTGDGSSADSYLEEMSFAQLNRFSSFAPEPRKSLAPTAISLRKAVNSKATSAKRSQSVNVQAVFADLRHKHVDCNIKNICRKIQFGLKDREELDEMASTRILTIVWKLLSAQPLNLDDAVFVSDLLGFGSNGYIFASWLSIQVGHGTLLLDPSEVRIRYQLLKTRCIFQSVLSRCCGIERQQGSPYQGFGAVLMGTLQLRETYLVTSVAKISNAWNDADEGKRNDFDTYCRFVDSLINLSKLTFNGPAKDNMRYQQFSCIRMIGFMAQSATEFARGMVEPRELEDRAELLHLMFGLDVSTVRQALEPIVKGFYEDNLPELFSLMTQMYPDLLRNQKWMALTNILEHRHSLYLDSLSGKKKQKKEELDEMNAAKRHVIMSDIGKLIAEVKFDRQDWREFSGAAVDMLGEYIGPAIERILRLVGPLGEKQCFPVIDGVDHNTAYYQNQISTVFRMVQKVLHHEEPQEGIYEICSVLCLPPKIKSMLNLLVLLLSQFKSTTGGDDDENEERSKAHATNLQKEQNAASWQHSVISEFSHQFDVDATIINGLLGVAKRDFASLSRMTARLGKGLGQSKISHFVNIMEQLRSLHHSGNRSITHIQDMEQYVSMESTDLQGGNERAEKGEEPQSLEGVDFGSLFRHFDEDNSGAIDYGEFKSLLKSLQLPLSEYRAMKFFAVCAGADGCMDQEEFTMCMCNLEIQVTQEVVDAMKMDSLTLIKKCAKAFFVLVLLVVFVMLGISAFTTGSTSGMVVNSALPLVAAVGLGGGDDNDNSQNGDDEAGGEESATQKLVKKKVNEVLVAMEEQY